MDKTALVQKLIESRKLSTNEECIAFDEAILSLQDCILPSDIEMLCGAFLDDTQDDEVMFGLVHLIESLEGSECLRMIANCSPNMSEARDWAKILNIRILNNPKYTEMYIDVIRNMNVDDKEKIIALFDNIKKDDPKRFADKIDYMKKMIAND
ncbi:hypothetical protein D6853_08880 [Butyrivibrio sp. X503]|uniref:Imm30 family immunity protein n=1 Tax=Butyrivibrio sp. X503 TaxID=2364878 RepID=UPI000EAACBC8|nr:Imm30 family immunity protein [Butyrivibrio sp. X503]RKM55659.1 hypothetical protein D6853_08880 [Butyrivibrio sp. X503]